MYALRQITTVCTPSDCFFFFFFIRVVCTAQSRLTNAARKSTVACSLTGWPKESKKNVFLLICHNANYYEIITWYMSLKVLFHLCVCVHFYYISVNKTFVGDTLLWLVVVGTASACVHIPHSSSSDLFLFLASVVAHLLWAATRPRA